MRLRPGDLIGGKYRIVRLIGDGGMGAVYEARHEVLGVPVALKFLHAELAKRPGLSSRFLQEARVSASIQSPHVTRVTDVDTTHDGSPFLVMELLSGESLQQLLDRKVKLPAAQAIDFTLQTLSGLEAAHAIGVVHRDLKPDNIFITPSTGGPIVKLLDFGIAKLRQTNEYQKGLTRPGAIMGTPEYMAPEQLYAADRVDHRADLYSLGAILYEMLVGERPADGDDAQQIIAQVLEGKIKRITEHDGTISSGLADVVHKALASDKLERFESAHAMRVALAPFAGELSHAGRLAATPAPASTLPSPEPDAEPPAEPARGVPKTLPPDDQPSTRIEPQPTTRGTQAATAQGGTQEAPRGLVLELAAHAAAEQQRASLQVRPPMAYAPPPAPYYAPPGASYPHLPPAAPRPKPRRALGAVLALLLGVLITGAGIALVVAGRQSSEPPDGATLPSTGLPPPTTIAPQGEPGAPPQQVQPPRPFPTSPPAVARPPGRGPLPRVDGGARGDAGVARADAGGFPFGIPGLPPMPSGLPTTFPTEWPQFPGMTPPPPPSQKPLAE